MLFLPGLELNAVCWGPQLMKKITKDGKGSSSHPRDAARLHIEAVPGSFTRLLVGDLVGRL